MKTLSTWNVLGTVVFVGLLSTLALGVPTLDLASVSSGNVGVGLFERFIPSGAGTGSIDTFVQIQKNGVEEGYNTDGRPVVLDTKSSATFNHSEELSNIPVVYRNGVAYREFLLDINEVESGNKGLLSLDSLKISQHSTGNLTGSVASVFSSPVYDLGADNWIQLDASFGSGGSGKGDMLALIPDNLFATGNDNKYIYLYSKFGAQGGINDTNGLGSSDGFEEWAHREAISTTPPSAPAPGALVLGGIAMGCMALWRKRKTA